jgi:hypothetical protein
MAWVKANTLPVAPAFWYNIYILRCIAWNLQFLLTDGRDVKNIVPCFYTYYSWAIHTWWSNLITTWTWNLIAITNDTQMIWYCNWTQYIVYNSANPNTPDTVLVKADNQTPDVVLSEVIIESKTWTQSEIQDYYDNTKSKYWIA